MTDPLRWPARFDIAPAMLTAYLLDPTHRDGGPKCRFLATFGYTRDDPDALAAALHGHCRPDHFRGFVPAYRAVKLYFDGPLSARLGPDARVRTVWQVDDADRSRTARSSP